MNEESIRTLQLFNDWMEANGAEVCRQIVAKAVATDAAFAVGAGILAAVCGLVLLWSLRREWHPLDFPLVEASAFVGVVGIIASIAFAVSAVLSAMYPFATLAKVFTGG